MKKSAIFIITCDTNNMTNECIKSLISHIDVNRNDIFVFDNGKSTKFSTNYKVRVIHNDKSQCFDTRQWCSINNFTKSIAIDHMLAVQWMIDNMHYDNVILLESDTIVNSDMTDIIDDRYITIGTPEEYNLHSCMYNVDFQNPIRIAPYFQYFNLKKIREYGIHYISKFIGTPLRDVKLMQDKTRQPDTGFFFYWSLKIENRENLIKYIDYHNYITHRISGSWKNKSRYN